MTKHWKRFILCCIAGMLCGIIAREIIEKYSERTIDVISGDTLEITSHNSFHILLKHNSLPAKTWNINLNNRITRIKLDKVDCTGHRIIKDYCQELGEQELSAEQVKEYWDKTTKSLKNLLARHPNNITFKPIWIDKYNRVHGILYAGSVNVNKYMLKSGGCFLKNTSSEKLPYAVHRELLKCYQSVWVGKKQ
ncbi:MAG: thermonuclease family protein [Alphaproteobacteria bacterium]|nr:thermonuclease family protein [Alphaproteobacteria bacterium]